MKNYVFILVAFILMNSLKANSEVEETKLNLAKGLSSNEKKNPNAKNKAKDKNKNVPVISPIDDTSLDLKLDREINLKNIQPAPEATPAPVEVAKDDFPMEDLLKMQNDKEVLISSFSMDERDRVLSKFDLKKDKENLKAIFYKTIYKFLNAKDAHCESNLISSLIFEFEKYKIQNNEQEMLDAFKFLRATNAIDDIMYDILESLNKDYYQLRTANFKKDILKFPFKNYSNIAKNYNLELLFRNFLPMPNEKDSCVYREFAYLQNNVGDKKDNLKKKNQLLKDLTIEAYSTKVLSLETSNMLLFLSESSSMNTRDIWLSDYVKNIINAKNKMSSKKNIYVIKDLNSENKFSSEVRSRFSKLTRRKTLYQKYDSNQIILLSQVLKKASQRMGVDPDTKTGIPYLIQEFKILNEVGEQQNYVEKIELDTQSQYNLARRLMRKDIVTLQMMTIFQKVKISYDDVVMAGIETGYISMDDIEYVVRYDDLWNPEISKSERMMRFGFKIAGYSTFFLPAPWNVVGALALSITEGVIESKNIDGASNDNPNTFIE